MTTHDEGLTMGEVRNEPLMNLRQVAHYLGVPAGTLYQWRSRGEGPRGFRVGRHVRYRREDVERWLEQHADPRPAA